MADLLREFQYEETLSQSLLTKSVCYLGTIRGEHALVNVTMANLPVDRFPDIDGVRQEAANDIYSWGVLTLVQDLASIPTANVNVVYPATETHIAKHRTLPTRIVNETPEMYRNVVLPYINTMLGPRLEWVRGILRNGVEADRVLYRDPNPETGFVLLPNAKWDLRTAESLYLLCLVEQEGIKSIRDLNSSHVPLLENIRDRVYEVTKERYNLDPTQLKIYFHYQPSYYHLHVHVAHVSLEQMDFCRSILLESVLQLLKLSPVGLGCIDLSYKLSEGHELWKRFSALN